MKKLMIILLVACTATGAFAQKGFHAGLKGAYNSTWLFNEIVSDAGDELDYKSSFGPQFGAQFTYMFNDNIGISLDVLLGTVKQKYTNRFGDSTSVVEVKFESATELKTLDLPVLFRYGFGGGAYLEVGPQFSIVNSAEMSTESYSASFFGLSFTVPGQTADIKSTKSYTSAVLGFGYNAELTDKLGLNMGLRFAWGLGDIFDEDKFRKEMDYDATDKYEPTNAAVGGIHLGLNYRITD